MLPSFAGNDPLAKALAVTRNQARRALAARNRQQAAIARHDKRAWVVKRRERTRQLIELGGLVAKSGLVGLTEDDRAAILVEAAALLSDDLGRDRLAIWRRRGRRALKNDVASKI